MIRLRLVAARIRPSALARVLGVTPQAASQMLASKRGIPNKHFPAIADLLDIPLPDLLDRRDLPGHEAGAQSAYDRTGGIRDDGSGGSAASDSGLHISDTQVSDILTAVLLARQQLDAIQRAISRGVDGVADPQEPSVAPDSDAHAPPTRRKRTRS